MAPTIAGKTTNFRISLVPAMIRILASPHATPEAGAFCPAMTPAPGE